MKNLLYGFAALCLVILTACGPSHTEQIDKAKEMFNELEEIIQKDGATSEAAMDKYDEIQNYNTSLAKDYLDYTPEERDYYTKVFQDGFSLPGVSETAMASLERKQNSEDFGKRPEDKSVLDDAKNAVDDAASKLDDAKDAIENL